MGFRRILWRIAVPFGVLVFVVIMGLASHLTNVAYDNHVAQLERALLGDAEALGVAFADQIAAGEVGSQPLQDAINRYAEALGARLTLIAKDGIVLADSARDPAEMENHRYRPEVQQALSRSTGSNIRVSETIGVELLYAAVPVRHDGELVGYARVALPLEEVDRGVADLRRRIVTAAFVATGLTLILGSLVASRTSAPIRELTRVVERMSRGDLDARLIPTTQDEVGALTEAFNAMGDTLRATIHSLEEERGRSRAVLDNMADGVLIVGPDDRVLLANNAALELLDYAGSHPRGRTLAEVVRHHELIALWSESRRERDQSVGLVEIGPEGPYVQAIVTPLINDEDHGGLLLLQDLTEIRQADMARREFVGNVSHELRTPLASMKALAETLHDTIVDDPQVSERFLTNMEAQIDSMTQMVSELLELTRIESGQVPLDLTPTRAVDVVVPRAERLRPQAERKQIALEIDVPDSLPLVLADAERAGQVVTNLLHNAIKFTQPNGSVRVWARSVGDEVEFSINDNGPGIPPYAVQRIFERFYKSDHSRAGAGTGLGLAISKHLVHAHGGRIWVESELGLGSTFRFTLLQAGAHGAGGNP
jgi:two-component system, OmpR family, phosphate regulon sensor histidine kinase PhoR